MSASRAYLPGARLGSGLDALAAELARIDAVFAASGAVAAEPAALQPAAHLLALYGEDIRARAFVTQDAEEGELMLRPDFTVPVLRLHMERQARGIGAGAARYRYAGPIWRRQAPGSGRPREYLQAGVELLGGDDPVAADAEVFALIRDALADGAGGLMTGDLSIMLAAVAGLRAPERWKAALLRHLWRPAKFRAVLEGYGAPRPAPGPARAALIAAAGQGEDVLRAHIRALGPLHGARTLPDVMARARELAEDAQRELSAEQIGWLEAVMSVKGPAAQALDALRGLDGDGALATALDRMSRRLEALEAAGEDAHALAFDAGFGRGLEYYDGFVFEFASPAGAGLPPLGGGGRYDALAARLGAGAALPAVGGIVRPEAMIATREAKA